MYKLEKNVKLFTSKFVGTGPSSCEKRIYRAAVSQRLRNTGLMGLEMEGSVFLPKRHGPIISGCSVTPHKSGILCGENVYIRFIFYVRQWSKANVSTMGLRDGNTPMRTATTAQCRMSFIVR